MNTVVITVAGTATRFNKDTASNTLKCLYWETGPKQTLLYEIMAKSLPDDHFVVVGGYLFDQLVDYLNDHCSEFVRRYTLVYNEHFERYGSGYSLIMGLKALPPTTTSVTFVEGDLFFDTPSYHRLCTSTKDAISINNDPIEASKAVAVVIDTYSRPHYIYDIRHSALRFDQPFRAIYNSAQMWKFTDVSVLQNVVARLTNDQIKGTNLEIIEGYFSPLTMDQIELVRFDQWCNCNTVADYRSIY